MNCQANDNVVIANDNRGNCFLIVVVLYILLAIIIGSRYNTIY